MSAIGILSTVGLVSLAERVQIQDTYPSIAGTYTCWKFFIGTVGASCSIQPVLVIHTDGTYEYANENGYILYNPSAHTLSLPRSTLSGTGIVTDSHIIFTLSSGDLQQKTVYIRQDALPLQDQKEFSP